MSLSAPLPVVSLGVYISGVTSAARGVAYVRQELSHQAGGGTDGWSWLNKGFCLPDHNVASKEGLSLCVDCIVNILFRF